MKPKQSIPKELRYTVEQFNEEFPDNDSCLERVMEMRFPGGRAECSECKKVRKHHRVSGRTAYACDSCGHHMYPLAGTIFEKSATSLRTWFYAMYQMGSTRCGISAKQIQRETGVTYKTAWRMFRQIRSLLSETGMQLEGSTVEVDEMYYGGYRKGGGGRRLRNDKGELSKVPVVGLAERKGRVKAVTVPDTKSGTLLKTVREYVLPKSTVFTDEYNSYDGLSNMKEGYKHKRIRHSSKVYVVGDVHTNTIEGFWSLVKRGISGVYHSVGQKYLQSYLNEYSFRYNRRLSGNLIFYAILANVAAQASLKPSEPVAENQNV
jgi:transposase